MKISAAFLMCFMIFGCRKPDHDSKKISETDILTTKKTPVAKTTTAETQHGDKPNCGGKEEPGGCNQWDEEAAAVAKRSVPADVHWETLSVSGMTCGSCEQRLVANLSKVQGILAVEADAELGQVRVATKTEVADLKVAAIKKIESLGYTIQ